MTMRKITALAIIAPLAVIHYAVRAVFLALWIGVDIALHVSAWILVPMLRATGWGVDSPSLDRRPE